MLSLDYKKDMSSYNANRAGVTMYDAAMSAVVMIPTEYAVSGKTDYYMSRTNSEYDFLADSAKWNLKDATDVQADISTNNDIITKMKNAKPTSAELKKANSLISSMEDTLKKLSEDIDKTDKAYIHNKTNDYLTFKQSSVSIKSRFGIKYSLIISAGILVLLCANEYLTQRRKEHCD
ncbi:hypothetical protein SDC9_186098 [bioreactor metagenome]|uniref:Uncharacterized protein n=1 Tax=bioreactor metagenome TaxID=1076179 RepID=A0A645HR09_9ZZZZ